MTGRVHIDFNLLKKSVLQCKIKKAKENVENKL